MSETRRFDVVIAGAGLVGLALAAALARTGLAVALADRAAVGVAEPEPESWDARVYAISPGSARFLGELGAWPELPVERLTAVEAMRVEGDTGSVLSFSAYDLGERALAWIVEERALRAALVPRVHAAGVAVIAPVAFAGLDFDPDGGTLRLEDGGAVRAALVVAADGVRSWARAAAGLTAAPRPYGQTAVVANFACARAHQGVARQWFRPDGGVLAWLPLPGRRISIVWSAPEALAAELTALAPSALAARVAEAGGEALGVLECITPPASFPLQFLKLPALVAHRLALVGDAAHGVHPLAGQGVNLGFGDAEALAGILAARGPVADPGAALLLERYARRRAEPVAAMQTVTDGLARLFGNPAPWLALLRNAGLAAVDRMPTVKRLLAQPALR
jgi:2-octaprenylphenol hydroxylase